MIPFNSKYAMPFLYILILVFSLSVILFLTIESNRNEIYKDIRKVAICEGKIEKIKIEGASAFVVLESGECYFLLSSENLSYKTVGLSDLIVIGDSIKKQVANDTLYIKRNDNLFKFVLGEQIVR